MFSLSSRLCIALLLLSILVFVSCATHFTSVHNESIVHHIVLFWFYEPGDSTAIQRITDISNSFSDIPGVLDVVVGTSLPSDRSVVDDSFDLAVVITFSDKQAYHNYLNNPEHVKATTNILKRYVKKMLIYNITNAS
jgi:hypothetical protein